VFGEAVKEKGKEGSRKEKGERKLRRFLIHQEDAEKRKNVPCSFAKKRGRRAKRKEKTREKTLLGEREKKEALRKRNLQDSTAGQEVVVDLNAVVEKEEKKKGSPCPLKSKEGEGAEERN